MTCRNQFPVPHAGTTLCAVLLFLVLSHTISAVRAGDHKCCPQCGADCCPVVECTIMVPCTVTETQVKNCIVNKQVEREETYTVFRRVAEKREFKKELCYLDDEVKTKEIEQKTCHIEMNPVVQTYRVKVPVCETQTVMVQSERCIDGELVTVEEPCTTQVVRESEEVRTRNCERPQVVFETNKCTIDYCVKTPKKHEVPCMEETEYKLVPETRTRKVTACVPQIERQTVEVQVTKMFPKTVLCCQHCAAKLGGQCQGGGCAKGSGKHSDGVAGAALDKMKASHKKLKATMDNVKDAIHH